jgi:RNA-directed DNA polymerase
MSTQLQSIATLARVDTRRRFRSLTRLLTKEMMADSFKNLKNKQSAVGIDGETYADFERGLAENCQDLEDALKGNRYRVPAIRRVNIPKANGKKRPLGITTISDKVVQAPVVKILEALFGSQFKEYNFGYRPRKGAHQALEYLSTELARAKGWVVDER